MIQQHEYETVLALAIAAGEERVGLPRTRYSFDCDWLPFGGAIFAQSAIEAAHRIIHDERDIDEGHVVIHLEHRETGSPSATMQGYMDSLYDMGVVYSEHTLTVSFRRK